MKRIKNNILFQPIKIKDFSEFLSAVGKTIFHGYGGNLDEFLLSLMDVGATLGLDETEERLAWQLIDRAIASAITDLVSENKNSIPSLDDSNVIERIKKFNYDKEIIIDSDFFQRPKECQFIKDIQAVLSEWLEITGIDGAKIKAIVHRLPTFFVYALHDEWVSNTEKYEKLLDDSPFSETKKMEEEWDRYKAFLAKETEEKVFNENFGLSQIFVPLCGYYNIERIEKKQKYITKEEGNLPLKSEDIDIRKTYKTVVDIETSIREWLKNDDKDDFVRVIRGGPGSGKSSVVKMLASAISDTMNVLFVPLYRLDLRRDVKDVIGEFFVSSRSFSSSPLDDPENLLIIFDGLDEIMQQGKASIDSARDFINQILNLLGIYNHNKLHVRTIITGRDLPVQAVENNFRKERQIIHILPYYVDDFFERYDDPNKLLYIDKRNEWWVKYGNLKNAGYKGLPDELNTPALEEITTQPLLNYLLALSFERKKVKFSANTALNEIYNDLIDAVYERGWQSPHMTIKGVSKSDYDRVLEEIAVSAWQGKGRTATLSDIEKRCRLNNLEHVLNDFQDKAKGGVTNLLTAFYFRDSGVQEHDGNRTFEFTHKSFGEYLVARKLIRQLEKTKTALERQKEEQTGWTLEVALENWISVCSKEPIDMYIYQFLCGEIQRKNVSDVSKWQVMICELIAYVLKNGMPYDKMTNLTFFEKTQFTRNSEEALLATLSACSRYTNEISKIKWPSPTSADEWFSKLGGQRTGDRVFAYSCLNHLDLTGMILKARDFYRADLSHSVLAGCDFSYSVLARANLFKANLSRTYFVHTNLYRANLSYSVLVRCNFAYSVLVEANLFKANLSKTSFDYANLTGVDLSDVCFDEELPHIFTETVLGGVKSNVAYIIAARGDYYFNNRDYWQAIEDYSEAINIMPENPEYYINRGSAYYMLKKYHMCIKDETRAIELMPDNAEYFNSRSNTFSWINDFQSALNDITKAIELNPKESSFYVNRGVIYDGLGEYDKALEDTNKAIELNAHITNYYRNRARTYNRLRKYKDALADVSKAVEINPSNAAIRADYAYSLFKNGKIEEALMELEKARELDQHLQVYYHHKSRILLETAKDNQPEADVHLLGLINLAIEYSETNWELSQSHLLRGEFFLHKGELDEALADIKKSIELFERHGDAWFCMSKYYEQKGDLDEKQRCFDMAVSYGYVPDK
ncbi:MAG: tetratricopeptide repeat protein [Defluviitaleaceae bacterium]|nr:tetratricopeptide repeat protein [Defluviitaleaceae bacterium]